MKKYFIPIIVIAIIVGLILLLQDSGSNEKVTIGYMGPLSGPVSFTGIPTKNAFQLAFDQRAEKGSYEIEVIYEDDKCDPKNAASIAKKFLEVDRVDYLVSGVCSSSVLAVAPLVESSRKVLMSSIAASPEITKAGDYTFRTAVSSVNSAKETAENLLKNSITSIGILVEENPYTIGWKDSLEKEYQDRGGRISAVEKFLSNEKDLATPMLKLHDSNPQAIVLLALSVPSAFKMLDAYKTLGLKEFLIGNELFSYSSVTEKYKDVLEGMQVAVYNLDLQSEKMKTLKSDYNKQFGKPLTEEFLGALGYDTFSIFYGGIQQCGKDSECMKRFLYAVKDYDGVSGRFSIDKNGDGVHRFVLKQVKNGNLQ